MNIQTNKEYKMYTNLGFQLHVLKSLEELLYHKILIINNKYLIQCSISLCHFDS